MTVKILVPISGGKDSQACLKLALQHYPPEQVRGLFCDTQFEHPLTYQHVKKLRTLYGPIQIDTVCAGSVEEKSIKYGRFPGGGARHCTDELKIQPTKRYCKALAEHQGSQIAVKKRKITGSSEGGFEVWYGMRSGESAERNARYIGKVCDELYAPHEVLASKYPKYLAKLGVSFRLCVLDWSEQDVIDFVGLDDLTRCIGKASSVLVASLALPPATSGKRRHSRMTSLAKASTQRSSGSATRSARASGHQRAGRPAMKTQPNAR